jgi:hypothetical protein
LASGANASDPAFTLSGDTNTGIYFPGSGKVGIGGTGGLEVENGITATTGTFTGNVDILGTNDTINLLISDLATNAVAKEIRFGMRHYTNAEEPAAIIYASSGASTNDLYLGGATGLMNGMQTINFCTAATSTTTGGTTRMTIDSSGMVLPGADNTYDLGSTARQWRNIYTADFHLNNTRKEEGNDVDGTKGDWTIQEGKEDLYLLNNETGKKYKFNLTEIE